MMSLVSPFKLQPLFCISVFLYTLYISCDICCSCVSKSNCILQKW